MQEVSQWNQRKEQTCIFSLYKLITLGDTRYFHDPQLILARFLGIGAKGVGDPKWLLWPSSLKVMIVKETSCSSKDLTLVRIHWRWFGTLTIMLVEMAC